MKVTHSTYNFDKSLERIDDILNSSDYEYKEHNGIPSEGSLTFTNGFYIDVTVVFVDIRGSKELVTKHSQPVLAKIYRSYISEVIAVIKGNSTVNDIFIEGDGVWAVFNTKNNKDVQSVFSTTSKISSLISMLNKKLIRKKYSPLIVGIGIEDGKTLCIKAGYNHHGVNEVLWIGKVVGESSKLSAYGNKTNQDKRVMLSERVYKMLSEHQQTLVKYNFDRSCYHANNTWKNYE